MPSLKNIAIAIAFALFTYGIWHVSARYTGYQYEKEKSQELVDILEKEQAEKLRAEGLLIKLAKEEAALKKLQNSIIKEASRETQKPVYNECRTTDDGVRIIEQAIDSYGQM